MDFVVSLVLNCLLWVMRVLRVWGCDLQVYAVEYHLKKQGVWVAYLSTILPVVVVLKWD